VALLARQAPPPPPVDTPAIEDNSFLIEEAYNQDPGVVQHISMFTRDHSSGAFAYTFTQEWPVDAAPANQLSYTVAVLSAGDGARTGFGDLWLNWRYQVVNGARVAIAPRLSVSLPTGDSAEGRGTGHAAVQANLPISIRTGRSFVLHSNAGVTIVPLSRDPLGDEATTSGVALGQSAVWLVSPRFNVLCEALVSRQQSVIGPGQTAWGTDVVISPGVRWAYNLAHGLQIVPGVAVPVDAHGDGRGHWTLLGYLSFEHPFTRP
jgi:hypothetical protein